MGDNMEWKVGDLVTRKSHQNDMVFKIIGIEEEICYLKGLNIRLCADSPISDLKKHIEENDIEEEREFLEKLKPDITLNRNDYFYLPGKILHIDGDEEYLKRCLDYYEKSNIWAIGIVEKEENVASNIRNWLEEYNPSIVIITGHDAFYSKKGKKDNIEAYKNSINFVNSIKEARKYEKSHEKLIIIAGACQSDYEELIKAGANFASSPKRINIHALDPAIIACTMSLSDINQDIDLKAILEKTKYGASGMGGIRTKGTMYIGYPR